jgi:hypothetical protein
MSEINEENIYSSVPEKNIIDIPDENRAKIYKFLAKNKGKFFTARQIAIECGFPTKGTQVEVRKAITELLELDVLPIVATSKGFGLATRRSQLEQYNATLGERKSGLDRRIKAVTKIILRQFPERQDKTLFNFAKG